MDPIPEKIFRAAVMDGCAFTKKKFAIWGSCCEKDLFADPIFVLFADDIVYAIPAYENQVLKRGQGRPSLSGEGILENLLSN